MSIKENTIVSTTDRKVTLLQWLEYTNKALENDTLTGVEVRQKGNATFSFVLTFKDGSVLESNEFVLAQGESINGATIRNGHLYLSLTNGDELDAGDLKPVTSFAINESQHLIVNFGDGTSQDLGAIFQGNVNIDGNLTANSIIENMPSRDYYLGAVSDGPNITLTYAGICKNGNKITFVAAGRVKRPMGESWYGYTTLKAIEFRMPASVGSKIYPMGAGEGSTIVAGKKISALYSYDKYATLNTTMTKNADISLTLTIYGTSDDIFEEEKDYAFRYEETFLLSDNLIS